MKFNEDNSLPQHIAVIMDGNGRWATKRALPRKAGHKEGVKTLLSIARHAFERGVRYFTVYAFSTENKFRPADEVNALVDLIREHFSRSFNDFVKSGIRVNVLGDRQFFPDDVIAILDKIENESKEGDKGTFNIALNYGARAEIARAINLLVQSGEEVTEQSISRYLYTANQPDPDIIIRTGGEKRLSNFLLYQSAYTELFFSDTLWPDFSKNEFDEILVKFHDRNRRYGKV